MFSWVGRVSIMNMAQVSLGFSQYGRSLGPVHNHLKLKIALLLYFTIRSQSGTPDHERVLKGIL